MEQMPYQAEQQQTGAYGGAAAGQPPSAKSIKDMFFTYRGRLNRKPFILRGFLLSILSSMMSTVMAEMTEASSVVMHLFALVPLILMVVLGVGGFMLIIRRWHDLGKSGWLSLLMLVPLMEVFFDLRPVTLAVKWYEWALFYPGFYVMQIVLAAVIAGTFRWEVRSR